MKLPYFLFLLVLVFIPFSWVNAQQEQYPADYKVDTRIDNMGYWRKMAELGFAPVAPNVTPPKAIFTSSKIVAKGVRTDNSPDVPVTEVTSTQSENSVFINPNDRANPLNSNNSGLYPNTSSFYGANDFYSFNKGITWEGEVQGPNGNNNGDPTTAIGLNGRYFVGYINGASGQSVSFSDDKGTTWTSALVAPKPPGYSDMLDKNHMWIDNSPLSPFNGYLYDAWTSFGGSANNNVEVKRSADNGVTWDHQTNISVAVNAGDHNQGVNLKTGPNGEAYATWAIYDNWPLGETDIGFAISLDGGTTWAPGTRIQPNIRGIRNIGDIDPPIFLKNMRVNSFPCMAVDISNGSHRGNIYVVWANIGVPGVNTGSDVDSYLIRSTDNGLTWSAPIRINQDTPGLGKKHYFPWIACDPSNGDLAAVFYDDRNVSASQCETFSAISRNGGTTWEDFKVSDVAFTPTPIPGLAPGYFGDYLAIAVDKGMVYPCWTDNRSGHAMTYTSPYELIVYMPNVAYNSHVIDDAATGNGNGNLDFGEAVKLSLSLKNSGNFLATNVQATISTDSPYITITDSTENYGDFAMGEIKNIADAFAFSAAQNTPGNENIIFTIKAVDANDSVFKSNFVITTHGPALHIGSLTVSDPLGNSNGQLDPGETADILIQTSNTGDFNANQVISQIISANPFVTINSSSVNIGTLTSGETVNATFNVTVNSAAALGTAVKFHNDVNSQYHSAQKDFVVSIGLMVEDWETGTMTKFPWAFAGQANWFNDTVVKYEGNHAARSGHILDSQTSVLSVPYNVMYDDSISFYRKTSADMFDRLQFFIDDFMVAQWAGNRSWLRVAYPVTAGVHTFKWVYFKSPSGSSGEDCAWVDYIVFPPEVRISVSAGNNGLGSICQGNTFQASGIAINYQTLLWSTSGSGTFNNPALLNCIYTPSAGDIASGSVVLTLTGTGLNIGENSSSNLTLTIHSVATANAGADGAECKGNAFTITGASATNYASLKWTSKGDGTFSDPIALMPVYTPGAADMLAGTAHLILSATTGNECPSVADSAKLIIHALPDVHLPRDTAICSNHFLVINGTTLGAASYIWSPGAQTSASITVDSTGVGIGSRSYTLAVTDEFGCNASKSIKVTFESCAGIDDKVGQVSFKLYPNPSDGHFSIDLQSLTKENVSIQIVNTTNESVYTDSRIAVNGSFRKQFDLSNLAPGAYILVIRNRESSISQKLVIK